MAGRRETGQTPSAPCCVLWHSPGAPPPARLVQSLARRRMRVIDCSDAMLALAHACRLYRAGREREDGCEAGVIVLLVQPRSLDDAAGLVGALRKFAPCVICWRYDESADPILRAVVEADLAEWAGTGSEPDAPGDSEPPDHTGPNGRHVPHSPGPELRLTGQGGGPRDAADAEESDESEPERSSILTEAELMMLLSDDPLPEPGKGGRGRRDEP